MNDEAAQDATLRERLIGFLSTAGLEELRSVLEAQPELLIPEAEAMMAQFSANAPNDEAQEFFEGRRWLLAQVRERGISSVFEELQRDAQVQASEEFIKQLNERLNETVSSLQSSNILWQESLARRLTALASEEVPHQGASEFLLLLTKWLRGQDISAEVRELPAEFQDAYAQMVAVVPTLDAQQPLRNRVIAALRIRSVFQLEQVLVEQPDLAGEEAQDLLGQLAWAEPDPNAKRLILEFRDMLPRCYRHGVGAVFSDFIPRNLLASAPMAEEDPEDGAGPDDAGEPAEEQTTIAADANGKMRKLVETVSLFVSAPTLEDSIQVLEDHPELLNPDNDGAWLVFEILQEEDRAKELIRNHREFLFKCREVGIEKMLEAISEASAIQEQEALERARRAAGPAEFTPEILEIRALMSRRRQDPQVEEKLIAVYRRILNGLQPKGNEEFYATVQSNLGTAYTDCPTGDPEDNRVLAIACYQEALRFWTAKAAPDRYASVQLNLGRVYAHKLVGDRKDNLMIAIRYYKEALDFVTPEDDADLYAQVQSCLGDALIDLPSANPAENIAQGIEYYQEALRYCSPKTNGFAYADIHNSLGLAYNAMLRGNRDESLTRAIAHYKEALRFFTPDSAPGNYAMVQNNLGVAYSDLMLGDRRENRANAIVCHQESLRIWTLETDPFNYGMAQYNLGQAYTKGEDQTDDKQGDLRRAILHYQEALHAWTPQNSPLDYASVQNSLGLVYADLHNQDGGESLERALGYYHEALRFITPENAPHMYAMVQNNLGRAYSRRQAGDHEDNQRRTIQCYQEALRIHTVDTAPSQCRGTNTNLAALYFAKKEWALALGAYRAAIDAGERIYRAGLTTGTKETQIAQNEDLYRHAAFAAAQLGNPADALQLLEQGRTRLLAETLKLGIPRPPQVPDTIWKLFEQATAEVRATQPQEATHQVGGSRLVSASAKQQQAARDAQNALNLSIERVRAYAPDFLPEMELTTFQGLLPDTQTAVIAFCITEQGSIGLVLHGDAGGSIQAIEVPLFTEADLDRISLAWANQYYQHSRRSNSATLAGWLETMTQLLAELSERLLNPILSALPASIERLIILPSRGLFLLPLHAAKMSSGDSRYVCDRYQISYVPSIRVMLDSQAKIKHRDGRSLCAIINPEEDLRLVFTPIEGAAIANLFGERQIYEGHAGTKAAIIAGMHKHAYLHFSCHGAYNWDAPLESGLALADGRLTLADLQTLEGQLSASRLVTLSACETGISDILQGRPEEYVGIPAGFMLAGVPAVVASLWAVPELSTAMLMEQFYRNHLIHGMNITTALHHAQRWVRNVSSGDVALYAEHAYQHSNGNTKNNLFHYMNHYRYRAQQDPTVRPFAHPYHWAAFTCTGV